MGQNAFCQNRNSQDSQDLQNKNISRVPILLILLILGKSFTARLVKKSFLGVLAIAVIMVQTIISCTDFERDSIYDEKSPNYRGKQPSSSSIKSSSSARSSSSVGSGGSISSSSSKPSSSSAPQNILACSAVPGVGTAGSAISPPLVTCNGSNVSAASISWQGAPNWANPAAGTYSNIKAQANCGGSSKTADCNGTLTVSPVYSLTCGSVPSAGTAGTAISSPSVTCSGTPSVSAASISWQGAPAWSNPTAGTYSNVKASASCGGQQLSANCSGTLTVSSPIVYGSISYQGQSYKTVAIGMQTWMAENLNYNVSGSKCYDNLESNCNKYGRLYGWVMAMDIDASYNINRYSTTDPVKHKGICPSGRHIPTQAEWNTLSGYVASDKGCSGCDAKHLKATSGWNICSASGSSYSCVDSYGFAALPGGLGYSDGDFYSAGNRGYWWSSFEGDASYAYGRNMNDGFEYADWNGNLKTYLLSVRCLQD